MVQQRCQKEIPVCNKRDMGDGLNKICIELIKSIKPLKNEGV